MKLYYYALFAATLVTCSTTHALDDAAQPLPETVENPHLYPGLEQEVPDDYALAVLIARTKHDIAEIIRNRCVKSRVDGSGTTTWHPACDEFFEMLARQAGQLDQDDEPQE